MRIGILGSGNVGKALAEGFVRTGHQVQVGARETSKLDGWTVAPVVSHAEAAQFGEMLVFAPSWHATQDVVELAGAAHFSGKVLIDTTNPIGVVDDHYTLVVGTTDSAGEQLQKLLPSAQVVKAFNSVGVATMTHPGLLGEPDMLIAGNNAEAKALVSTLLKDFGWQVHDLGDIEASRWLEALVMVGIHYGMRNGKQHTGLKLLSK
jgi:8-hydroxy-5-deazaflavin:NADPH oxidoreductase